MTRDNNDEINAIGQANDLEPINTINGAVQNGIKICRIGR